MSDCRIQDNVKDTLIEKGIIDEHNMIIGNVSDTYNKINEINADLVNKYGPIYDSDGKPINFLSIQSLKPTLGRGYRQRMLFNHEYGEYINTSATFVKENTPKEEVKPTRTTIQGSNNQEHWYIGNLFEADNYNHFESEEGLQEDVDAPLNSPIALDEDDSVLFEDYPATLGDWIESRKRVLNSLNTLKQRLMAHDKTNPSIKSVNMSIEEIEEQLSIADDNNPYNIYSSAKEEIDILKLYLESVKANPDTALETLVDNNVSERIKDLNMFFLNRDMEVGDYLLKEGDERALFYHDFMESFGKGNPEEMEKMRAEISALKDLYKDTHKKVVEAALKTNPLVKQQIKEGKTDIAKNFQKVLDYIENNDFEVGAFDSKTLGLSYGGILGQLLYLKQNEGAIKEKALVGNKINALQEIWSKFKDVKDSAGNFLSTKLFHVDQFGVRTSRLTSKYSDSFYTNMREVEIEKRQYDTKRDAASYEIWRKAEKDITETIDPRLLVSVFDKYSSMPEYLKFFSGYSSQQAQEYEKNLKEKLGPVMFEIEKRKAEQLVDDFHHDSTMGTLTPRQIASKNPFAFVEHNNSENYYKESEKYGVFMEPTYTITIPKTDFKENFNNDFKAIENNKDLSDFYSQAYKLMTEYCNPTFKSEGINVGALDLQTFLDLADREVLAHKGLFGKVGTHLKALYHDAINKASDSFIDNIDSRLADKKHDRQKLVTNYSSGVSSKVRTIAEQYKRANVNVLVNKAKSLGMVLSPEVLNNLERQVGKKVVKTALFYSLAESVARAELNKVTSTNIMESLHNSAYLAANIRSRRAVVGLLEAVKDVAKIVEVSKKGTNNTQVKGNDSEIYRMLYNYGQSNVYGEKYSGDMENMGKNLWTKIAKTKVFGMKTMTEAEKIALNTVLDIFKQDPKSGFRTFTNSKGVEYASVMEDGEVLLLKTEPGKPQTIIKESEYKKAFEKHVKDITGTNVTIGSLLLAWMSSVRSVTLGFSPRAGVKNRLAGMSQTMSVAASERYGFNLNDYHSARRMLRGMNTRRYLSKIKWIPNYNNPKYTQIEMLKQLVSNLELEQNRSDELLENSKFGNSQVADKVSSLRDFMMDFAMNNPEAHNQLEIAVSLMMNTKVTDNNGKEFNLIDKKNLSFNIYEPGTLKLKKEFRNDKNITLWENFKSYKDPVTGEESADSFAMTSKIRVTIEQTQGNYNNEDRIALQNTVAGNLSTMFTRYLFENTNMQFGEHQLDLRTGEMDIRGRKINLLEHAPTTMVYLMGGFAMPLMLGAAGFIATAPWIAAASGIGGAAALFYGMKKSDFQIKASFTWKEMLLAKDFALETLLLMGKTPLNTYSYGAINPKFIDNNIKRLQNKNYDGLLTKKNRMMLSECAQELATKFNNYTMYTIMAALAKVGFLLLAGNDDDDDETYIQKKIKEFVNIENVVNSLLNDRNQVLGDINRYMNPSQFYDDATAFAFFRTLTRDFKVSKKIITGGYENMDSALYDASKLSFIPGLNLIPNNLKRAAFGIGDKDRGIFSDDRVYEGKDWFDKKIGKIKRGEDWYKQEAKDNRADLRERASKIFEKQLKEEVNKDDYSKEEWKDLIEERINDFMSGTSKDIGGTNKDLIESGIFEVKSQELDELEKQ